MAAKKRARFDDFVAGTFIGLPLDDGRLAFARVIHAAFGVAAVVVYRSQGKESELDPKRATTKDLRLPPFATLIAGGFLRRVRILAHGDGRFTPGRLEKAIRFEQGPGEGAWYATDFTMVKPTKRVPLPLDQVANTLVSRGMLRFEERLERVRDAVARDSRWAPGDPDPDMQQTIAAYIARTKADEVRGRPETYEERTARALAPSDMAASPRSRKRR